MSTERVRRKKKPDLTEGLYKAPGEYNPPSTSPLDHCFLLYGNSGIGKTSVMAEVEDCYVLQFDSNRSGNLQIRETGFNFVTLEELQNERPDYTPWDIIEAMVEKVIVDDSVKVVIIDNADVLYKHSYNDTCYRNDLDSPVDANDYGVTWGVIKDKFTRLLQSIKDCGKKLAIITHDRVKEIEIGDGNVERIEPDVGKPVFAWIQHNTNYAFYMTYDSSGNRVVTLRSNPTEVWTKCSVGKKSPRFCDPEGNEVKKIPAGSSPEETWANIMKSWNNELYDVDHKPAREKTRIKKRRRTEK